MVETLGKNWGWVAVRGVIAILFGLLTLRHPGVSLGILVLWFGAYAFLDGISMIVSAISREHGDSRRYGLLAGGIVAVIAGLVTFFWPHITARALLTLIAIWAIATGIAEIAAAIRLRKEISGEWMFVLSGILAVALGFLLLARPAAGALAMVLWIGVYALFSGLLLIALSFRLRSWQRMHPAM
ncbi:MAG TPA: HdeD family acid-resistance protein [Gemmatimonadaceae bacterium]|nr:HdeD family acid-resistance protein [Gemmatimonadaceae bacterium]